MGSTQPRAPAERDDGRAQEHLVELARALADAVVAAIAAGDAKAARVALGRLALIAKMT